MLSSPVDVGITTQYKKLGSVVLPFPSRGKYGDSQPIIDLAGLYDRNPAVQRYTADRIGEIAMENGFFYIRNHGVSTSLIDAVYAQAENFFLQNAEKKNRYYIGNAKNHRGYVPLSEKGNYQDEQGQRLYEAFDMGAVDSCKPNHHIKGNPLVGPNTWPDQTGFQAVLTRYLGEMNRLVAALCWAFEVVLGLEHGFFQRHMQHPISQLRLLHYLENKSQQDTKVTMGAHTDYECFTILHSRTPSLQILDLNSNWIDAPPIDNTFYFNIGDMLEAWSGGLLVATPHRVVNYGNERFSIPFFAATDFDTVVSSIVSPRHQSKQRYYKPIKAGQHLLSQLMRDFPYLRKQYKAGLIDMPISAGPNPFESRINPA